MNTPKTRALVGATIAGASGFLAWLATVPPEQQDALLGPIVSLLPLHWRPTIGAVMRALSSVAAIYTALQASHSGPQTPPQNPEDKAQSKE